ncbi:MAG: histidine phosphatase family protein [Epsilonproteobacteria bacterium]|nr:histidine phosphatase family protein [Campylobacterota bacterium]
MNKLKETHPTNTQSIPTIQLKPFYFIRHGQTDWNLQGLAAGQSDVELNKTGLQQAHDAATLLESTKFTNIASSPLKRALKTAEIIAHYTGKPVTIVDSLKEACWGTMEGKPWTTTREQAKTNSCWIDDWRNNLPVEGAEMYSSYLNRIASGLSTALELDGPILVVAHGGVYAAIQELLVLPTINVPNCSILYHQPPQGGQHAWTVHDLSGNDHEES